MKWKNYLLLAVFCALVAVSSSVTVHAQRDYVPVDDRYLTLFQKFFTMKEAECGKWGQKNGFTYLYSEKNNTAKIVGIPMDQKIVNVPEKIDGKTVTKIDLYDVFRASEQQDYRYELYDVEEGTWLVPKVEILNIPKTVKLIDAYEGGSLNEGYCRGMQSFLMHLKKFNVASGNRWYRSYKGILYTKNGKKLITVPRKYTAKTVKVKKGTTKIADSAFSFCTNI